MRIGSSPTSWSPNRRGFALIIVVALLALLIMVLVSLATLTRIEASIGANSRLHAQARQNARFALDLAIGELQRHAGADTRISATADILPAPPGAGLRHWTGVWDSDNLNYRAWLVSGTENLPPQVEDPGAALVVDGLTTSAGPLTPLTITGGLGEPVTCQLLAGPKTIGTSTGSELKYVVAPLVPLEGPAPDGSGDIVHGGYAWWIGDEGVKASLALPDRLGEIDYDPYVDDDGDELRTRLRQQMPLAHQAFRATDASVSPLQGFDPALSANQIDLPRVIARSQLAYLTKASGTGLLASSREHFHDWTTVAAGVLASTNVNHLGLKRDLSLDPGILGDGFRLWADFQDPANMEAMGVASSANPPILDPLDARRCYLIQGTQPTSAQANLPVRRVAPVLTECLIHFAVDRVDPQFGRSRIRVTARVVAAAWNPYTSALVPVPMQLSIVGLPTISVSAGGETQIIDLASLFATSPSFGNPFTVQLEFQPDRTNASDFAAWLPGRIHNWRTPSSGETTGLGPTDMLFYGKRLSFSGNLDGTAWSRLWTDTSGGSDSRLPEAGALSVTGPATQLVYRLVIGGETVSETRGPAMSSLLDGSGSGTERQFAFGFRIRQPPVTATWLDQFDPRWEQVPASATMAYDPDAGSDGTDPADYGSGWSGYASGVSGFLLSRDTFASASTMTYDNDTPVFELPRQPLVSLGQLQHLQLHGARPFSVGNSWGNGLHPVGDPDSTVGSWFDRFFFSGLTSSAPDTVGPLAVYHLRPVSAGTSRTLAEIAGASPFSSQHLLINGAFNVNSTSAEAWAAVLRSMRPFAFGTFHVAALVSSPEELVTGTVAQSGDTSVEGIDDESQGPAESLAASSSGFFRFSQSVQETFQTDGSAGGFDRTRYRLGFRGGTSGGPTTDLDSTQIDQLASAIVDRIREAGPFRSLEHFLGPSIPLGGPTMSVIDSAIDSTGVNAAVTDSSSQRLTQADILTAIAPFLQCRSDTFLIRTYGETVNPVTGDVEARAWCEATVQRIPTLVESGDITAAATGFGRRFVITSFRWLSPDDI